VSTNKKKNKRIQLRINESDKNRILKQAKELGLSVSEYILDLVFNDLKPSGVGVSTRKECKNNSVSTCEHKLKSIIRKIIPGFKGNKYNFPFTEEEIRIIQELSGEMKD